MRKEGADWVAWIIKFLCGMCLGAFGVFLLFGLTQRRTAYSFKMGATGPDWEFWGSICLSAALVCGAFSAGQGHRFWYNTLGLGGMLPPTKPAHSPLSRALTLFSGLWGVGLGVFAFAKKTGFF